MPALSFVTAACIAMAANTYDIPPSVIAGILKTEGGRVGQYSTNSNGTRDLGPMQINDKVWTKEIANEFFRGNQGMAKDNLLYNGCFNVRAGAWILRQNIDQSDGNLLDGIGRYHSWTPKHKVKYQKIFLKNFQYLMTGKRN